MSLFRMKEWVCLASEQELATRRARAKAPRWSGLLDDRLWRQIEIDASPDQVKVWLSNVDEEAARGGYWKGACATRKYALTWNDLHDHEGLALMFGKESAGVNLKLTRMLDVLREYALPLRKALAA